MENSLVRRLVINDKEQHAEKFAIDNILALFRSFFSSHKMHRLSTMCTGVHRVVTYTIIVYVIIPCTSASPKFRRRRGAWNNDVQIRVS